VAFLLGAVQMPDVDNTPIRVFFLSLSQMGCENGGNISLLVGGGKLLVKMFNFSSSTDSKLSLLLNIPHSQYLTLSAQK